MKNKLLAFLLFPWLSLHATYCIHTDYVEDSCFFVEGSFLWWKPTMDNLEYATHTFSTFSVPALEFDSQVDFLGLNFEYDPGVRVAVGASFCDWQFIAEGTYFHSQSKGNFHVAVISDREDMTPLWFPAFMGMRPLGARASWTLDFGTLDLTTARTLNFCNRLFLSPNFGLRAAWVEQKYRADYDNVTFDNGTTVETRPNTNVTFHSDYQAIGFKGGIDFQAPIINCISLDGRTGASLLYGKTNHKQEIDGFLFEPSGTTLVSFQATVNDTPRDLRPVLEAELGLSARNICNTCFSIFARYYFAVWFDQFPIVDLTQQTAINTTAPTQRTFFDTNGIHSNLQLQGLVTGISYSF